MLVERRRGPLVESRHLVHVAVVNRDGALIARAGDPGHVTFLRSTAKPFQAVPLVDDGVVEHFGMTTQELALCCASHSAEPPQVDLVRGLLRKIGCTESDLMCGPHASLSGAVAHDYAERGVRLTPIHSNCSGKHAGMLALARHRGWPTAGYAHPDHPVQRRCLEEVARWTGVAAAHIVTAGDGCGVLCFALPLRNLALGYARLASAGRRVVEAMLAHPELVAGSDRPCTQMMRAHPGRVVAKVGAEGVYAALVVPDGVGVALKVEDGHDRAAILAVAAVLGELGVPVPDGFEAFPLLNTRAEQVGEMRVKGGLLREKGER